MCLAGTWEFLVVFSKSKFLCCVAIAQHFNFHYMYNPLYNITIQACFQPIYESPYSTTALSITHYTPGPATPINKKVTIAITGNLDIYYSIGFWYCPEKYDHTLCTSFLEGVVVCRWYPSKTATHSPKA